MTVTRLVPTLAVLCSMAAGQQAPTWATSNVSYAVGQGGITLFGTAWFRPIYDAPGQRTVFMVADDAEIYANAVYYFDAISATNTFTKLGASGSTNGSGCQADTASWPGDRHPIQQAYDSTRRYMWITGGVCNSSLLLDTYYLDLAAGAWTKVGTATPGGASHETRFGSMVYDSAHDVLIWHGYDGGANALTYHYCPTIGNPTPGTLTATQSTVCTSADAWIQVESSATSVDRGARFTGLVWDASIQRAILWGGLDASSTWRTTTWTWEPVTKAWSQKSPASNPPRPVPTDSLDPTPPMVYVGSGLTYTHISGTTPADWVYDSGADSWINLGNLGGPTSTSSVTYDSVKNALIAWNSATKATVWIGQFPASTSGKLMVSGTVLTSGKAIQ